MIAEDYELPARDQAPGRIAEVKAIIEVLGIDFRDGGVLFNAAGALMAATLARLRGDYGSVDRPRRR